MSKKIIVFLTGTRADFGKIKSLIKITQESELFDVHIFVTGMHMLAKYGKTIIEVEKSGFKNIYPFINHGDIDHMDRNLAKTIDGFSHYISEIKPDLIVVHGDRIEAMAGAIVGSLNNTLVAHIEGGEVSGTIDELIRHSISKLSHIHLTSNEEANKRLIQMGEDSRCVFNIGSPDLDVMNSNDLPSLEFVKNYYGIDFQKFAIVMFHPVTTETNKLKDQVKIFVDSLIESNQKYIIIYPNNDIGSDTILQEYERLLDNTNFKIYPSLRFEYFLVLLKNAQFMIGNSSAGVREAPYYNIPTINLGNRQNNRVKSNTIISIDFIKEDINNSINKVLKIGKIEKDVDFGDGNSDKKFYELLQNENFWHISNQKQFKDLY
ncbi:UDP-N-acetylglucosamine 2-epimerase [Aliarcobacter butzleri]|uniref:UDP-N-acetylglucosamine 2-epimerase n=1 Tax=Aliarcobacter butzleri TaxID=28197 RepID=A0AAP4UYR2_9BACT|nr:UDP-N-acetylglucosamine 2-epimerase [Aliarcobacter butzleri]MCT7556236.1 UDP-N-acetylglucosamine 2-epimerase [Aliarcobacter butzleri]MCT7593291.1 UDP-N-acetylglucosamine 2-epimerase [Aliarcobacter butzleri]MCT7597947.1 UDP-N-acetylglucosamine 2-epimerase [Aliarcobacter butzleri]MDK2083428.1 UDP-N-acetylglucosamine 2-epimerase [Aliarcobacter butzleri]MDK2090965.1 UDP-N-acetylglucosamine 2-epimerase [Aliarcobacter butzleri]